MSSRILSEGEVTVWGIDYSVEHLYLGIVGKTGCWNVTGRLLGPVVPLEHPESHGERLQTFSAQTEGFLRTMAGHWPPALIYVEQPFGKQVAPVSQHLCGVIASVAALFAPTYLHSPSSWKGIMGFGTAGKEAGEDYPPLRWALGIGMPESLDHNSADALAIAAAAATQLDGWVPPPPAHRTA